MYRLSASGGSLCFSYSCTLLTSRRPAGTSVRPKYMFHYSSLYFDITCFRFWLFLLILLQPVLCYYTDVCIEWRDVIFFFLNQSPQLLNTGELSESCVRSLLTVVDLSPLPQSQHPQLNLQPTSRLCSLTRLTDTGVPLPLVRTAAVGGARGWNAGIAYIAARLYFDSSGRAGQGGGIRSHTQPNALQRDERAVLNKRIRQHRSFTFTKIFPASLDL